MLTKNRFNFNITNIKKLGNDLVYRFNFFIFKVLKLNLFYFKRAFVVLYEIWLI